MNPNKSHLEHNASEHLAIEMEYGSLATGVSAAGGLCPFCHGGSRGERSLSVTRQDSRLLYNCHRASCGARGVTTLSGAGRVQPDGNGREGAGQLRLRPSYDSLRKEPVPPGWEEHLLRGYGITKALRAKGLLRWTYDHSPRGKVGRLVLPVLNRNGVPYGYSVRDVHGSLGTKSLLFVDDSAGSWYVNRSSTYLVIVEDQLSALRASPHLNAVALLGTNLTDACLREIKAGQFAKVFLALDADAFPRSIRMAVQLRPRLGVPLEVVKLPKDLKNMTEPELQKFIIDHGMYD